MKRSVGETVRVEADAFVDGHDKIQVELRHRPVGAEHWQSVDMSPVVNDRWFGEFDVHAVGWHEFTLSAWVDRFGTWRYDLQKRINAGQNIEVDLQIGAEIVAEAAADAEGEAARSLKSFAELLPYFSNDPSRDLKIITSLLSADDQAALA